MSLEPTIQAHPLHLAAVSAKCWIAPGHNSPRFKNGRKSMALQNRHEQGRKPQETPCKGLLPRFPLGESDTERRGIRAS